MVREHFSLSFSLSLYYLVDVSAFRYQKFYDGSGERTDYTHSAHNANKIVNVGRCRRRPPPLPSCKTISTYLCIFSAIHQLM